MVSFLDYREEGKNVGTVNINCLLYKPGCEGKAGNRAAVIPGLRR